MNLKIFCEAGLKFVDHGIAEEKLSGDTANLNRLQGQSCAYRAVLAAINDNDISVLRSNPDTKAVPPPS